MKHIDKNINMKEVKLPIMFSQITNNIELRAFSIQVAQNFISNDDSIDNLIDKSKVIEDYIKGNSKLPDIKEAYQGWLNTLGKVTFIYQLGTPTTELVDATQIAEAESYSMVISQGAKAVEWGSFETE